MFRKAIAGGDLNAQIRNAKVYIKHGEVVFDRKRGESVAWMAKNHAYWGAYEPMVYDLYREQFADYPQDLFDEEWRAVTQ